MPRTTIATRQSVRLEAERFLAESGFDRPPLPPDLALAARKLEVVQLSFDDLLIKANLPEKERAKIQAVLDINEKAIVFRDKLPSQKQNWGKLHEIGHEFIPWHHDLIYYCPLLYLPAHVQTQLEGEADIFAAEAFFFGSQFTKLANKQNFGLASAKYLAEEVYATSYHATFMHYVEQANIPCALLVWEPAEEPGSFLLTPNRLVLRYWVHSTTFRYYISVGMVTEDENLLALLARPSDDAVKHPLQIDCGQGRSIEVDAESFSNSYNVFTMVTLPDQKPSTQAFGILS